MGFGTDNTKTDTEGERATAVSRGAADRPAASPERVRAWRIAFLVFCTAGVLLSADLVRLHVRVHTDAQYHAFCAVSEYLNCESVAASRYAVALGMPVALWGLIGYLFMGGLCVWGLGRFRRPETWPFGVLFWLTAGSVGVSLALFFVTHRLIHSLCIVCLATYGVNGILCGIAFVELKRGGWGPVSALAAEMRAAAARRTRIAIYMAVFAILVAALGWGLPPYWEAEMTRGPGGLLTGTTPEGAHWIGARKPAIEIIEYSDYQCPYCYRGHIAVRDRVSAHPDLVRLVHRHYPLRQHPFAFGYAMMAHCAGEQGRFWEASDYIYANGRRPDPVGVEELAAAAGIDASQLTECLASDAAEAAVRADVTAGEALRIPGTPTFIIDDRHYPGAVPEEVFEFLTDKAAATSKRSS